MAESARSRKKQAAAEAAAGRGIVTGAEYKLLLHVTSSIDTLGFSNCLVGSLSRLKPNHSMDNCYYAFQL